MKSLAHEPKASRRSSALKLDICYVHREGWHRLTAIDGAIIVGWLEWADPDDPFRAGEIVDLFVVPHYRRHHVATALWNSALQYAVTPVHSALRTRAGEAWARSVGGYLLPLHDGQYLGTHSRRTARTVDSRRPVRSVRVRGGLL